MLRVPSVLAILHDAECLQLTSQFSPSLTFFLSISPSPISISYPTHLSVCLLLADSPFLLSAHLSPPSLKPPHTLKQAGDELFRAEWNGKLRFDSERVSVQRPLLKSRHAGPIH